MYKNIFDEIREMYKNINTSIYEPYPIDWIKIFSPIEYLTWSDIRDYDMKMWPQYPIGKYFADFANLEHKIVIECDGKQWHDAEKDKVRDQYMIDNGWTVYRIKGSECVKQSEVDNEIEDYEKFDALENFYKTGSGVVKAIYYFHYAEFKNNDEKILALKCLDSHRSKGL